MSKPATRANSLCPYFGASATLVANQLPQELNLLKFAKLAKEQGIKKQSVPKFVTDELIKRWEPTNIQIKNYNSVRDSVKILLDSAWRQITRTPVADRTDDWIRQNSLNYQRLFAGVSYCNCFIQGKTWQECKCLPTQEDDDFLVDQATERKMSIGASTSEGQRELIGIQRRYTILVNKSRRSNILSASTEPNPDQSTLLTPRRARSSSTIRRRPTIEEMRVEPYPFLDTATRHEEYLLCVQPLDATTVKWSIFMDPLNIAGCAITVIGFVKRQLSKMSSKIAAFKQ
ncbi:hypothetical protein Ciccas_009527 [Cichlidogyrus casuarinus]|uniref:Uncharacterized protein n=1 Tax=Cichlidogyrus casuarinus TaxID=1844966 RepID=A0ABD2PWR8_9PLAT